MRIRALIFSSIAIFNLNAADNNTVDTNTQIQPQVLAYQEILKNKQEQNKANMLQIPPIEQNSNTAFDFNVIGTVNINNSKYCFLLVESNRVVKATIGMVIKNKKIEDINEYGINISDSKSKNITFLPILTKDIDESDIVFVNKDNKKNLNMN